ALFSYRRAETSARGAKKRIEPRIIPAPEGNASGAGDEGEGDEAEDEEEESGSSLKVTQPKPARSAGTQPWRRSSSGSELPALGLLAAPKAQERSPSSAESRQGNAPARESGLGVCGVRGESINARPGPVVTLYELEPAPGIKSSRVSGLADDIARSRSAM